MVNYRIYISFLSLIALLNFSSADSKGIQCNLTKVWGLGLEPENVVLPARYFFIESHNKDGKRYFNKYSIWIMVNWYELTKVHFLHVADLKTLRVKTFSVWKYSVPPVENAEFVPKFWIDKMVPLLFDINCILPAKNLWYLCNAWEPNYQISRST